MKFTIRIKSNHIFFANIHIIVLSALSVNFTLISENFNNIQLKWNETQRENETNEQTIAFSQRVNDFFLKTYKFGARFFVIVISGGSGTILLILHFLNGRLHLFNRVWIGASKSRKKSIPSVGIYMAISFY